MQTCKQAQSKYPIANIHQKLKKKFARPREKISTHKLEGISQSLKSATVGDCLTKISHRRSSEDILWLSEKGPFEQDRTRLPKR